MISDNGKTLKKMAQYTVLEVKFAGFITIAPTGEIWFGYKVHPLIDFISGRIQLTHQHSFIVWKSPLFGILVYEDFLRIRLL